MMVEGLIRELSNGTWFLLNICFLIVIVVFLFGETKRRGVAVIFRFEKRDLDIQVAVALLVYFTGSAIRNISVWAVLLHANYANVDVIDREAYSATGLLVAAIIGVIGAVCLLRVFSRERWGHWVWVSSALLSVSIPIIIHQFI